jgi:uncharacterized protein (DUF433 family)
MEIPKELEGVLVSTPDTLHGAVRFAGTRVFAHQLFDYILTGRSLDEFLSDFAGVKREDAQAVLHWELQRIHCQLAS